MAKLIDGLSVFLPSYNEGESIKEVVLKTKSVLVKTAKNWELIVVNDGSSDATRKVVENLAIEDKRIKVISHKTNLGYGASLQTGFYGSRYDWIAFIDSDGQFDFSEIGQFIKKQKETHADLVIGYYKKRQVSKLKMITSKMWELAVWLLFGLKVKDIDCGFKLISKKVIDAIPHLESERGAFVSSELLIKAKNKGFKIVEIPVTHFPRTKGEGTGRNLNVIVKSFVDLAKLWLKTQTLEFWILAAILIVAAVCRLYKIDQYMTFLGDEGRDVIVVRRLLTQGHPPLIGPGTSIGNMYLGPLYYYLMAPALLVANFSPVGPAVQIALLGVITVWFIWFVGREWFGKTTGLIAAGLYAISPTVIIYSRSSWNPNIMPFFALLSIYAMWKVWKQHKFKWLLITGVAFAFVLQSHYLGLLLIPTLFIFWFLSKVPIRYSLLTVSLFALLMSPLLFFDIRHNWINSKAIYTFFTIRQETVSVKPWSAIPNTWPIYKDVITRLPAGRNEIMGLVLSIAIVIFIIFLIFKRKILTPNYLLLITWFAFGLIGLGLYKQHIYDHYYGFFFIVPFLFIGLVFQELINRKNKFLNILMLLSIAGLIYVNLLQNPLKSPPNQQLQRSQAVSKKVIELANGQRFNFSLIAESNYDSGYRYFLDLYGAKIVDIDAQNTSGTITDQLIVLCEKEKSKCDPTHNSKAEIANFGWTKIENEQEVFGVTIYKLVHTK